MHRFFLSNAADSGIQVHLTGSEAHHAQHVLRLARGDAALVLDGAGLELDCTVAQVSRDAVMLDVRQRRHTPPPPWRVTLFQAVAKSRSMDFIVQKAAELGVTRLVPILTERSVPQFDKADAARKVEKWRTIAIESLKQCGWPWLPVIESPESLPSALTQVGRHELSLVASLRPEARHPRAFFERSRERLGRPPRDVAVWIGPEGDFADAELAAIQAAGASSITLGQPVLRCETAAIYCLSVVNYELSGCEAG